VTYSQFIKSRHSGKFAFLLLAKMRIYPESDVVPFGKKNKSDSGYIFFRLQTQPKRKYSGMTVFNLVEVFEIQKAPT